MGAAFAGLTFFGLPGIGGEGPPAARTAGPAPTVRQPSSSGDTPAGDMPAGDPSAAAGTYLVDLEPDRGRARLALLPEELVGGAGYEKSIAIACPSNQTGDKISEVTFEVRNRYQTFEATLRPYYDPPDDYLVQLETFSDPVDRDPGVPEGGEPSLFQVRAGEDKPVSAPIEEAYYLRLRVMCEKPEGLLILTGAYVR